MCRWMAYSGGRIVLEDLLLLPKHNLIDQSLAAKSRETPTNGDGFGVGWYGSRETPGVYRSVRPAWNDFNLRDLAANIETPLFLAHVRATSAATIQETNCHPFRYGKWLFVHNGEIVDIDRLRRELLVAVAPGFFHNILGTTDSEVMFHLALTFGLEKDPPGAMARMVGFVERASRERDVGDPLWATFAVTDGRTLWCVRYASDGDAPSLYYSKSAEDIYTINPAISGRFGPKARTVVSEPVGAYAEMWNEAPQSSLLEVRDGDVAVHAFRPAGP
jgi:predicted glutamine amidotransferase